MALFVTKVGGVEGAEYTPVSITAKTSGFVGFISASDLSMYNSVIVAYSDNGTASPAIDSATNCNARIIATHVESSYSSNKRVIIFELTNITGAVTVSLAGSGVGSWSANATGAGIN